MTFSRSNSAALASSISRLDLRFLESTLRRLAPTPLVSTKVNEVKHINQMGILTRYLGGGGKCLRKFRIHLNNLRFSADECFVSELDLFLHPLRKLDRENWMDHIHKPLFWHLLNLISIWNVCKDRREFLTKPSNVVQGEALIARHRDEFDVRALDIYILERWEAG